MMFITKRGAQEREQLVFKRDYDRENYKMGGICRFDKMSIPTARELIKLGYLDPGDAQNYAPSAKEIVDFCSGDDEENWYVHGYVVSPERDDCRISIEGCGCEPMPDRDKLIAFVDMFRYADEFKIDDGCYCWFD